jgi:Methyltransferase domain
MTSVMRRAVLLYSVRSRHKKARDIGMFMDAIQARSLLLCGVSGGRRANEAIIERALAPRAERVLAFDVLESPQAWPFVVADARRIPLADASFDLILANAVIEHVGEEEDQRRLVAEHCRVGRSWVITTPNRWFPVESHTSALFKHWLPRWRERQTAFTRLLSLGEFRDLLPPGSRIVGRPWSPAFTAYYRGGDTERRVVPGVWL